MDYKIQNNTDAYIINLRQLFDEEFNVIPKHFRQELDQYIKAISEKVKIFIAEITKLLDNDDSEVTNKYITQLI